MSFDSAIRTFGAMGRGFMMNPAAGVAGEEIGLNFLEFYALGRGGVLGDVDGSRVADEFFFFNPDLVAGTWNGAKGKVAPSDAATHYMNACATWGRSTLGDIDELDAFCAIADKVTAAAEPTPSSSLFAGWRAMPLPDDAAGRATVHVTLVLREHRGGAHVEAVKQVGLGPFEAVATNSPHMLPIFGWPADGAPDPATHKDQATKAEHITDELVAPAYAELSEAERTTFATVIDAITAKLG